MLVLFFVALSQLVFSPWFYISRGLCSGGGSVVGGEHDLWAIGGGDGQSASGVTQVCKFFSKLHIAFEKLVAYSLRQVFRQNVTSGEWGWSQGPQLNHARYGHCATQVL